MEEEVREIVHQAEIFTLPLLNAASYKAGDFSDEPLRSLNQKILSGFERIKALIKQVVTGKQALEKSESEYLLKADRILLREYEKTIAEKYNLESLMKKLKVPSENQPQNWQTNIKQEMSAPQRATLTPSNSIFDRFRPTIFGFLQTNTASINRNVHTS